MRHVPATCLRLSFLLRIALTRSVGNDALLNRDPTDADES
jgi:hypothetical protein